MHDTSILHPETQARGPSKTIKIGIMHTTLFASLCPLTLMSLEWVSFIFHNLLYGSHMGSHFETSARGHFVKLTEYCSSKTCHNMVILF